jgi:hypothetical protein
MKRKKCDKCKKESKDIKYSLDNRFQEYFWLCGKCRREDES